MRAVLVFALMGPGAAILGYKSPLRRAFLRDVRAPIEFDDLAECELAYDKLEQDCKKKGMKVRAGSDAKKLPGSLTGDAQGDGYREHSARNAYSPPTTGGHGGTSTEGWDYSSHGEDWHKHGECGHGMQSPIDLAKYVGGAGQTKYLLWFDYYLDPDLKKDSRAKIVNDGHGLTYNVIPNKIDLGYVKIGGDEYFAKSWNFHTPSEHTFDGSVFPLELQILNQERTGLGMLGISLVFREGKSNPFLAALKTGLNNKMPTWSVDKGVGVGTIMGMFPEAFDLDKLIPRSGDNREHPWYNYQGSLTSPPCTSGVDWWVLAVPVEASMDEIMFVKKGIMDSYSTRQGNARETQPLAGRPIYAGITGFQHAIKFHNLPEWQDKDALQSPRGYTTHDLPWGDHWEHEVDLDHWPLGPGPAPAPGPAPGAGPAAPAPVKPASPGAA